MEKFQALKLPGMFNFRYYSAGLMGSETHVHAEQPVQRSPFSKGKEELLPINLSRCSPTRFRKGLGSPGRA